MNLADLRGTGHGWTAVDPPPCPYCRDPLTPRPDIMGRYTSDVVTPITRGRSATRLNPKASIGLDVIIDPTTLQKRPPFTMPWQCRPCRQMFFVPADPYVDRPGD